MNALEKITTSNGSIHGIVGDVTSQKDIENIFNKIDQAGKELVSVIYNAGNNNAKPF